MGTRNAFSYLVAATLVEGLDNTVKLSNRVTHDGDSAAELGKCTSS